MLLTHAAIRGRRDIQPIISFLSQRVNVWTEEDYNKLKRLIQYILGMIDLMTWIGATYLFVMIHFIDVVCATYNDFRSHSSGATILGYGIVYSISLK